MNTKVIKIAAVFIAFLSLVFSVQAQELEKTLPPLPKGPLLLTSATPEMQKADFWINRLKEPDKLIKTDEQVEQFNEEILRFSNDSKDVFKIKSTASGAEIKALMKNEYDAISGRKLFNKNDKYISKTLFTDEIKPNMNMGAIPKRIKVRWAAAVKHAYIHIGFYFVGK